MKGRLSDIKRIEIGDHDRYRNGIFVERVTLSEAFHFHWHGYYEIEYVTGGQGSERINGEEITLLPGVMHVVSPSDFHELIPQPSLSLIKICFDASDVDHVAVSAFSESTEKRLFCFTGEDKEHFDRLFLDAAFQTEKWGGSERYPQAIRRLLEGILLSASEYVPMAATRGEVSKTQNAVARVLPYVHANYMHTLSLSEVAEKMHFSAAYLSRCFHESMGVTFSQYVRNLRMELAARLLSNTDADVTDVCYEVGFSSPASFSNDFKKHFDMTPSEYRRRRKA